MYLKERTAKTDIEETLKNRRASRRTKDTTMTAYAKR